MLIWRRWHADVLFCFVLFALQLSVCLWWHDYRRDDFPTLIFGVVMADLARHLLREEPFALSTAPAAQNFLLLILRLRRKLEPGCDYAHVCVPVLRG